MTNFKVAGPDIVFEEFDDDFVVLNLFTGQYFGFNEAAQTLWQVLSDSVASNEIQSALKTPSDLGPFIK